MNYLLGSMHVHEWYYDSNILKAKWWIYHKHLCSLLNEYSWLFLIKMSTHESRKWPIFTLLYNPWHKISCFCANTDLLEDQTRHSFMQNRSSKNFNSKVWSNNKKTMIPKSKLMTRNKRQKRAKAYELFYS